MSGIRLLPPAVADAIAAGEVVERPASVVKELCENAIDAGAARIDVELEDGGLVRIRVSDDGEGIAAAELPLAVARHATSKIGGVGDLERVASLGFRGEALASIAAVAEVVLASRRRDAGAGSRLRVRGSQTLEHGPAAHPPGTTVEVRDLFATTPARLRFLRTRRGEGAACVRAVADLALCRPEVAFSCRLDGRSALRTPGGVLLDALRGVLGAEAAGQLIEIAAEGEIEVGGAVSEPRAHRAGRGGVVLVVNRRRVHNRALGVAVEEAYRGLLPTGRHPFGVVTVGLDPTAVDVNVHPAKREVRFRDEGRVFAAVQRACWAVVQQQGRPHSAAMHWDGMLGDGARPMAALALHDAPGPHRYRGGAPGAWPPHPGGAAVEAATPPAEALAGGTAPPGGIAALGPLRSLGQVGTTWMIAESPLGVVLVDPHAAHEKVLYAELLATWEPGAASPRPGPAGASQLLLLPVLVEVDATAMARRDEHAGAIAALGFAVDEFGPRTLRCTAVPAACAHSDVTRLLLELLDTLDDPPGGGAAVERRHRVAALLACHSAVRFGDALGAAEQQRLLDRLARTDGGTTCPHGRPTAVLLDDAALRRAFRRP
ncbi:MAG TPA: DNA mismatch repair endonuclease MutL [Candidatus Dormibacteraeota bacterium]|nr:DNA mismatch repair endonuclease MutL [Candidatus Dormibacteraeota bacterium]